MWTPDIETRRRYVHGLVRLGVWSPRLLLERGEIPSDELPVALSKRVDLYRFTDLWNGVHEAEDGLADTAWMIHATTIARWVRDAPMTATDRLEAQVLAHLAPTLEARLPKDVGSPPLRPFGCWTFDLGWPGLADGPGLLGKLSNCAHVAAIVRKAVGLSPAPSRDGVLHIMNVMVPRSPFDDLPALAASLRALIAHLRTAQPQVRMKARSLPGRPPPGGQAARRLASGWPLGNCGPPALPWRGRCPNIDRWSCQRCSR